MAESPLRRRLRRFLQGPDVPLYPLQNAAKSSVIVTPPPNAPFGPHTPFQPDTVISPLSATLSTKKGRPHRLFLLNFRHGPVPAKKLLYPPMPAGPPPPPPIPMPTSPNRPGNTPTTSS